MIAAAASTPDSVVVTELSITVPRQEVLRYLGYRRGRTPTARVADVLSRLWEPAHRLMAPRGIYRVVEEGLAASAGMPAPTEVVGLGICTLGPDLEQEESNQIQAGKTLEALILDAFGSAAAEVAADLVNTQLCAVAQGWGFRTAHRVSPGYGRWPIEGQRELVGLLEADTIGITLTEGSMMVPRKSVSFGVGFEQGRGVHKQGRHHCAACELKDCAYRFEEPDPESEAKVE